MEKRELRKKFHELKRVSMKHLNNYLDHAIRSGALDLESYDDDSYIVAKAIIVIALKRESQQWEPLKGHKGAKLIKNLQHFI